MTDRSTNMKAFHALLRDLDKTMAEKENMIALATTQRTNSAKLLTDAELERLVYGLRAEKKLNDEDPNSPRQRMIRKMYFLARQLGWFAPSGSGKVKVDTKRLNDWCLKYSTSHTPLVNMNNKQLSDAVTAFTNFVNTDSVRQMKK